MAARLDPRIPERAHALNRARLQIEAARSALQQARRQMAALDMDPADVDAALLLLLVTLDDLAALRP